MKKTGIQTYGGWRAAIRKEAGDVTIHWDGDKDICEALTPDSNGKAIYFASSDHQVACRSLGSWDGSEGLVY